MRPRGHKQRKLNDRVYSFLLFVSLSQQLNRLTLPDCVTRLRVLTQKEDVTVAVPYVLTSDYQMNIWLRMSSEQEKKAV